MKRTICLLLSATIFVMSVFAGEPLPSLGERVSDRLLKISEAQRLICMTHSAQLDPCLELEFDAVEYTVAFDKGSKRVTYIETSDKNFRTSRGHKIGDEAPVSDKDVKVFPGWIVLGPAVDDGWQPIIGGPDAIVKLKGGNILKVWNRPEGSSSGLASAVGFAKGPQRPNH